MHLLSRQPIQAKLNMLQPYLRGTKTESQILKPFILLFEKKQLNWVQIVIR